jgi:glutathione reductase (NADPH)
MDQFDLIVVGGGSGGLAAAIRGARNGARVAILEPGALGGTCVNAGCIPKKAMWYAGQVQEAHELAVGYGFGHTGKPTLDWEMFCARREAYIDRIHTGYAKTLDDTGVVWIHERGMLVAPGVVRAGERELTAPHIVLAAGSRPHRLDKPGFDLGMTSDGFFGLRHVPARTAIVGGGYIAVELAGVLRALGGEVDMYVRGRLLQGFDEHMTYELGENMIKHGINISYRCQIEAAHAHGEHQVLLDCDKGDHPGPYDALIWAVGRQPNSDNLGLDAVGIALDDAGHVVVDAFQQTNVQGIYAIGDLTQNKALTPVAVKAGRCLVDRLFADAADARVDYANIPSVVFSHPPMATVGLTEKEAGDRFGPTNVKVFQGSFIPMQYGLAGRQERSHMKMVCTGADDRVVGMHMLGVGVDEMMQGFAVAIRLGACKRDFDATIAIHPTSSEEAVLLNVRQE